MTPAGWTIMILSVGLVTASCAYCIARVLRLPPHVAEDHIVTPLEIDPD
jgi:hypothetical protein